MDKLKEYIMEDLNTLEVEDIVKIYKYIRSNIIAQGAKRSVDIPVQSGDLLYVDDVIASLEKAMKMVNALCKPRGSKGSREWIMSIPARREYDPDLVIADALSKAKRFIEQGI